MLWDLCTIDFGVFWASWGRSGKEPGSANWFRGDRFCGSGGTGSGNRVRVPTGSNRFCGSKVRAQKVACPRFRRFRCSMGPDRLGSVPEVCREPVLGTGFWEPKVVRRFRVSGDSIPQGSESYFVP